MYRRDLIIVPISRVEDLIRRIKQLKRENSSPHSWHQLADEAYQTLRITPTFFAKQSIEVITRIIPESDLQEQLIKLILIDDRVNQNPENLQKANQLLKIMRANRRYPSIAKERLICQIKHHLCSLEHKALLQTHQTQS